MCKPASFVITKDKVFWSKVSDSHEDIIKEFSLAAEVAGKICIVRCEITPPKEGRFDLPADEWIYKTDQEAKSLPEWFDAAEVEARCRMELVYWLETKVVLQGRIIQKLESGVSVFVCGGTVNEVCGGTVNWVSGGTVNAVWGGTVNAVWGGTVNEVCGGIVNEVCGGIVNKVWGGTVNNVCGGTVKFYISFSCKLTGLRAVVINRIGKKAKRHVGSEKTRTVTGK